MAPIQLHYYPHACSMAPHILLNESGLPFDLIEVKANQNFELEPAFQKLNPKLKVPVLVLEDNTVITENIAIMTAIAQLIPNQKWLGKTNLDTVRVYEWMSYLTGTVHGQAWTQIFRPSRFSDDSTAYDEITSLGYKKAQEAYEFIEGKLKGPYALGDDLTIVDLFMYVVWRWGDKMGNLVSGDTYPKYAALMKELVKRPAVVKMTEAEGISQLKL